MRTLLWTFFWLNVACVGVNVGLYVAAGHHWFSLAVIPANVVSAVLVAATAWDLAPPAPSPRDCG